MIPAPRPDDLVVTPQGCRFLNRRFACAIGRSGITGDKREGDGARADRRGSSAQVTTQNRRRRAYSDACVPSPVAALFVAAPSSARNAPLTQSPLSCSPETYFITPCPWRRPASKNPS